MMTSTKCAKCGRPLTVEIADGCSPDLAAMLLRIAKCNRCVPQRRQPVTIAPAIKPDPNQPRLPHAD